MKGVQCYELFGGIALKNHAFPFFFHSGDMNGSTERKKIESYMPTQTILLSFDYLSIRKLAMQYLINSTID